jgi:hypothetical protein
MWPLGHPKPYWVLDAISAAPIRRSQAPVGSWPLRQLQFSFIESEL